MERREALSCCHHQDDGLPMRRETMMSLMIYDVEVASLKRFCVYLEEVRKMLTAGSDAAAVRLLLLLSE